MARGFESKSVEEQQQAPLTRPAPRDDRSPEPDPAIVFKRRKLELARIDCQHQLATAHAEAHREMLRRALEALDREIAKLGQRRAAGT